MLQGIIQVGFREVWCLAAVKWLSWALTPAQLHFLCYFHLSGESYIELLARNSCSPHSQKHTLVLCDKGCLLPVASVYLIFKHVASLFKWTLLKNKHIKVELLRVKWGRRPGTPLFPTMSCFCHSPQEPRGSTERGLDTLSHTSSGNSYITEFLHLIKILERFPLYI